MCILHPQWLRRVEAHASSEFGGPPAAQREFDESFAAMLQQCLQQACDAPN